MTSGSKQNASAPGAGSRRRTPQQAVDIITKLMAEGKARTVLGVGNSDSVSLSWTLDGVQHSAPSALPGSRLAMLVIFDAPDHVAIPTGLITFDRDVNAPAEAAPARETTGA